MEKTILCVDDTPQILLLYRTVLEGHGYKVVLASNGREGLDALKRQVVDCVILDYRMPEMDGAAVVQRMTNRETSPPVILVSGSDPPRELRVQVDAFIEKPFRAMQLLECVEGVTGVGQREQHEH
jgi:CheY-like chemotaxis protein